MAHALVERFSRPGDVVLDPFCGRGTIPLAAALRRRTGVGVDLNPLAHVLTAAVLDPPSQREARDRLALLRIDWTRQAPAWREQAELVGRGSDTAASLFHVDSLAELLYLRHALRHEDRTDRFLLAALAGILHGSRPSYLTDAMPNTFSLPPRYTRSWLAANAPDRPRREVFPLLASRLRRLFRDGRPVSQGVALRMDARSASSGITDALRAQGLPDRVRLVVTSPPYLRVVRYGAANWLRLWLLGEDPARVDGELATPANATSSAAMLAQVLSDLRPILAPDAIVVLVLGHVERDRGRRATTPRDLAADAWRLAARPAGYVLAGIADDPVADARKLTRVWGDRAGRASRLDRLLVIAPAEIGRRRALASLSSPIDWSVAPWVTPALDLARRSPATLAFPPATASSRPPSATAAPRPSSASPMSRPTRGGARRPMPLAR
jgi:site-specific DNA-methyltransferase (adenine-specific)